MPSLLDYVREMIARCPGDDAIGRIAPISSLTTTTIVSSKLAFGGNSENRWAQKWAWRPLAASDADRERYTLSYAPSTGTLTHDGANYSDTTATNEIVILTPWEPQLIRDAIDVTIRSLRSYDRTPLPMLRGQSEVSLEAFPWIRQPADIVSVEWSQNPVLSRDRYFEKWGVIGSDGKHYLDEWELSGSGATVAKSTAHYWRGGHVVALTRNGTDCYLFQRVPVYRSGKDEYDLRGKEVSFVVPMFSGSGVSAAMAGIPGGTPAVHTGGGDWEVLTATYTVPDDEEAVVLMISLGDADATIYVGEAYLVETQNLDDTTRRDAWPVYRVPRQEYTFEQWGLSLRTAPTLARQLIVGTQRPYPGFDPARLASGAADTDESDAPLEVVACGAISRLFRGRAAGDVKSADWVRADYWWKIADALAARHMYVPMTSLNDTVRNNALPPRRVLR